MRLSVAILVAAALVACKKPEKPVAAQGAQAPAAAQPASQVMQGKILEKLEAAPYSYLKLQTAQGEVWAAVQKTDSAVGSEVTVQPAVFEASRTSETLKRTFEKLYLGSLVGPDAPAGGMPGMPPPGMMGGAPGEPVNLGAQHAAAVSGPSDVGVIKVDKASGADARTVAEVFAQRDALKEKPVTIRAKVVKMNPGVMGKNWLHLRDGTGTAEGKNNDLTVTSAEEAAVGDVVTVKGTIRVNKDFGFGYNYPVIMEDAKISKK